MKIKNRSPSSCQDTLDDFGDIAQQEFSTTNLL